MQNLKNLTKISVEKCTLSSVADPGCLSPIQNPKSGWKNLDPVLYVTVIFWGFNVGTFGYFREGNSVIPPSGHETI
jgi:hypothetical protein